MVVFLIKLQKSIMLVVRYCFIQSPNLKELLTISVFQTILEMVSSEIGYKSSNNPSSNAIFKDGAKIIPEIYGGYKGDKISHGEYHKDGFTTLSALTKLSIKLSIISSIESIYSSEKQIFQKSIKNSKKFQEFSIIEQNKFSNIFNKHFYDLDKSFKIANFIADITSRFILISGENRQEIGNTHLIWYKFLFQNTNKDLIKESFQSAIPKNLFVDYLGTTLKDCNITSKNFIYYGNILNIKFMELLYTPKILYTYNDLNFTFEEFTSHDTTYKKANYLNKILSSNEDLILPIVSTYSFDFVSKLIANIFFVYLFGTAAKSITSPIHTSQEYLSATTKNIIFYASITLSGYYFYKQFYDPQEEEETDVSKCIKELISQQNNLNEEEAVSKFDKCITIMYSTLDNIHNMCYYSDFIPFNEDIGIISENPITPMLEWH
ncbi:MAG: hypothetical protein ACI8ZF_000120 [Candidatus Midichloriaceae bacterium]